MATLTIRIHGKEYQIACDDGQEAHALKLASQIDLRVRNIANAIGHADENMLLILTAMTMADELQEAKSKHVVQAIPSPVPAAQDDKIIELQQAWTSTMQKVASQIEQLTDMIEKK